MPSPRVPSLLVCALALLLAAFGAAPPVQAQSDGGLITLSKLNATEALSQSHVRDFIRLRIAAHQIQQRYKANADAYDDVIQAFFAERNAMLRDEGWTGDAFDALQTRIINTQNAIEAHDNPDAPEPSWSETTNETVAGMQEMLKEIDEMTYLSEDQRTQMRQQIEAQIERAKEEAPRLDSLQQTQRQAEQDRLDATRPDWPAVRPYLDVLDQLTDYVALNRTDPPTLDARPEDGP